MAAPLEEKVLEKLGFSAPPPVTLAGLSALYFAWCRGVPFDNVAKLIHVRRGDSARLPGDDPASFFSRWLAHGCGGTCWAGNGALHHLLRWLGFDARRVIATMLIAPDLPPNHGSVVVVLDGAEYVVDASMLHGEPLPMRPGRESTIAHPAWGVTGVWVGEQFRVRWRNFLTAGAVMECAFNRVGASAVEFSDFHEATRSWSPFNFSLSVSVLREDIRIGAALGKLARIAADGVLTERPVEQAERRRFLIEQVGMSEELVAELPDDIPFAPPPRDVERAL